MPSDTKFTAMATIAFLAALTACSPSGSAADDPPNAKDCIFTLAAKLPSVPGMAIKSATATPEPIPENPVYGLKESWKVVIEIEAASRRATYVGQCGYTENGQFAYEPSLLKIVR